MKKKSVPGGVLGIVGGAFILLSGIIIFAQLMMFGFHPLFVVTFLLYLISGVLGIIGGALALTKSNIVGGILQAVGVVFGIAAIVMVLSVLAVISLIVLLAGMIVSFAVGKPINAANGAYNPNPYAQQYRPPYAQNPYQQPQYQQPQQPVAPQQPAAPEQENKDEENK